MWRTLSARKRVNHHVTAVHAQVIAHAVTVLTRKRKNNLIAFNSIIYIWRKQFLIIYVKHPRGRYTIALTSISAFSLIHNLIFVPQYCTDITARPSADHPRPVILSEEIWYNKFKKNPQFYEVEFQREFSL